MGRTGTGTHPVGAVRVSHLICGLCLCRRKDACLSQGGQSTDEGSGKKGHGLSKAKRGELR